MSNLRIIGDNAADRATLSASSTNGALVVTNLQSDKKSNVWQATTTSARLGATWTAPEAIQGVAAPFCNWSPTATWRKRLTSEGQATNLCLYSEQFDNAAWTKTGAPTLTANYSAAPDGNATAERIVFSGAGQSVLQATTLATGVACSGSIFVKGTSGQTICIVAGSVSQLLTLDGTWQRLAVAATSTGNTIGITTNSGATARDIQAWGAQLTTGALSSYYPVTSAAATRPLGYIDTWQSYAYDSGAVLACPAPAITLRGWTAAQSASAYAYGGGACARLWLPSAVSAYGMAIDIVDTNNLQGYLEAARLVCGPYWSPTYNTSSLSETFVDAAIHTRTDAGDLWTDASTIHKKVPIDMEFMPATDRATLANILRASRAYPIFLSVFPGIADLELERAHTVYGKRMSDSEVQVQMAILYGTKIEVESI